MGWFRDLFRKKSGLVHSGEQLVIRSAEIASALLPPSEPNFTDHAELACEMCSKPLVEVFITTGGSLGDPAVWRDHPVAVDGWACVACGLFRFPRKMSPERITEIMAEGVEHGRAGRVAEAEHCFARIVWDWPGYTAGHLNYAEATRERLATLPPDDEHAELFEQRMAEQYEAAIAAFLAEPTPAEANPSIARACVAVAQVAYEQSDLARAKDFIGKLDQLVGIPEGIAAEAERVTRAIETRLDLFHAASKAFGDRIRVVRRPLRKATPDVRVELERAFAGLEKHLALAPDRWQAHWLHAKALTVLDRDADDAWRAALAAFPGQRELAQDYSIELILANRIAEARDLMRAYSAVVPDDAQAYSNLATLEILSGDLDAAERMLSRCVELDPKDTIVPILRSRIVRYRNGFPLPRPWPS